MDIYKLNANFEPTDVIENYKSWIWSERFRPDSSFVLTCEPGSSLIAALPLETLIGCSETDRVMYVETIEKTPDLVTISGRSLESWWERRASDTPYGSLGDSDELWEDDNPGYIVLQTLFQFQYDSSDPNSLPITVWTNNVTHDVIDAEYMPAGKVSDWLNTFCEAYDMGHSLVPNSVGTPYLKFRVYTGTDRTSDSSNALVAFGSSLDNLQNTKKLNSTANWYNIAYVCGDKGTLYVPASGTSLSVTGAARRVLAVDASDIKTAPGTSLNKKLKSRGLAALADQKKTSAFDGESPADTRYKYRTDYFLGDLVELWDDDGTKSTSRVTEYVWASDDTGERAFPTLENVT